MGYYIGLPHLLDNVCSVKWLKSLVNYCLTSKGGTSCTQCGLIWPNFAVLAKFLSVYSLFGKIQNLLWQVLCYWANVNY